MILQVVGCISREVSQAKKYLSFELLETRGGKSDRSLWSARNNIGRIFILSLLPVLNPTHLDLSVPCNWSSSLPSFFSLSHCIVSFASKGYLRFAQYSLWIFFLPTFLVTSPPRWVHKSYWWGADQMSLICRQQWLAMLSKKAILLSFDTNFSPQAFQDLESQYFFSMEFLAAAHYWPPRVLPVVQQVFSPQATISSSSISADGQTWNPRWKWLFPLFCFLCNFAFTCNMDTNFSPHKLLLQDLKPQ